MASAIDSLLEINEIAWSFYNSNPSNKKKINMAPKEINALLQNLKTSEVRYILIGGFAMAFHGLPRATGDIDLWIDNTPTNMERLKEALINTGFTEAVAMQKTTQLVPGFAVFNLLESDFKIDLMHSIKAFKEKDFDACFLRAKIANYNGIDVAVMDAKDLLNEKIKTNRIKDLVDIDFLKNLLGIK